MKDPLDIAFIAIGVDTAFRELGPSDDIGQLELVGDVLALAPELDRHYELHFTLQDYAGCWAYEVAEAFGEWCARTMLKGQTVNITDVQQWLEINVQQAERSAA